MLNSRNHAALSHYRNVNTSTGVEDATPHRLIQMLLEGALDKIAAARGHMRHGDAAEKGRHISWAISIISGLQGSLDLEQGGEVARNLDALYDYMVRRLGEAGAGNDPAILDEVASLLLEVKRGWDELPGRLEEGGGVAAAR